MNSTEIDLKLIAEKFADCITDDQICVKQYINAYGELAKFFDILGKVFGFVLSDIRSKLDILTCHIDGNLGEHYQTVDTMTTYEIENKLILIKVNGLPNGSRTFLRLHRALEFIASFLEKIQQIEDEDKLSPHAIDSYEQTLKQYHPWIIQKAVAFAMKTLGTRISLLDSVNKYGKDESLSYLRELITNCHHVYNNVQSTYREKEILDLP